MKNRSRITDGPLVVGTDPGYLVIEEVARTLRRSVSGIRKLIRRGVIPANSYFRIGGSGRLLFRRSAIEALVRDST